MDQAAFTASCFSSQWLEATLWFVRKVKFLSEPPASLPISTCLWSHDGVLWSHDNMQLSTISQVTAEWWNMDN